MVTKKPSTFSGVFEEEHEVSVRLADDPADVTTETPRPEVIKKPVEHDEPLPEEDINRGNIASMRMDLYKLSNRVSTLEEATVALKSLVFFTVGLSIIAVIIAKRGKGNDKASKSNNASAQEDTES